MAKKLRQGVFKRLEQENMVVNFRENTESLLIERLFKGFDFNRLVQWGQSILDAGAYAESVVILAAMKNSTKEEIERYFLKSIAELGLEIPLEPHLQLQSYAKRIAEAVLNGDVSQELGFLQMLKVAKASDHDFRYAGFLGIEEDLDNLYYGREARREGLWPHNQEAYIKEEFRLFSRMEDLQIPLTDRQQEYCMICGGLSTPKPRKKYSIRRPFFYHVLSCGHCGSERLKSADQHFVKQKIIQRFQHR